MYFPYLRGRQYELLSLRELAENNLICNKVIPVLEPVRMTSSLLKTLQVFINKGKKIALILNPEVGALNKLVLCKEEDMQFSDTAKEVFNLLENENIIKSFIINSDIKEYIKNNQYKNNFLIINRNVDCIDDFMEIYESDLPEYTLIPDSRVFKRIITKGKIHLEDNFNKKDRNLDYLKNTDEHFSDMNKYFKEDGYNGFSDYSIVGEEYIESGFAPIAVAIHIVYLDNKNELRIHHFVSNSNEGIEDPAGKFGEALKKLVEWCKENQITETEGLKDFYRCYEEEKYPGLGVVKKYSMMHHIELISRFLEER